MSEHLFGQGETLFRRGDPSEFAYLVVSGQVELLDEHEGREIRIGLVAGGEIVGEMGLVEERPRSLTARALTEVRASAVTREGFVELILHNPEEGLHYLRALFERMRTMNGRDIPTGDARSDAGFDVTLVPLTATAAHAVPAAGLLLQHSPFRIGRAQDAREVNLDSNDLVLADEKPYHVSRNHCAIEIRADGVFVHDRGSYLGTIVNGTHVGGKHRKGSVPLAVGENEVIAGSSHSPFQFRVTVTSRS